MLCVVVSKLKIGRCLARLSCYVSQPEATQTQEPPGADIPVSLLVIRCHEHGRHEFVLIILSYYIFTHEENYKQSQHVLINLTGQHPAKVAPNK